MTPRSARPAPAMADVVAARRRSSLYGIDPAISEIPFIGDPGPAADALRQLSVPVLDGLLSQVGDSPLAVVLADRAGRLTHRGAAAPETRAAMDATSLDLGYSLAEASVGTNGVGTSLETRRPAMVVGGDHHLECFHGFTCANAPIIQPVTGRVEGSVGLVCPVGHTGPLLMPTALQLASQISGLLLARATPQERFLLEEFLRRRRSHRSAVATIGDGVLIATPAAQALLVGVDPDHLWQHVDAAVRLSGPSDTVIERAANAPLHLRCSPLYRGGELEGASLELAVEPPPTGGRPQVGPPPALGDLVGVSDQWQVVVQDATSAARLDAPTMIVGERGTGRFSVAEAIARQRPGRALAVFDAAETLLDGARDWVLRVRAALSSDMTVVLRRVDQLPADVAAAVASVVAGQQAARVVATTERTTVSEPGLAQLVDQLRVIRIEIPPLRRRRDDIPVLARHLAAQFGTGDVGQEVLNLLYRQPWPGNVTELRQTVRAAQATARGRLLLPEHLPRHVRTGRGRRPLHGLQQQEADAIVAAIASTATRAEAAAQLGISRATLFRRIKAYGLDVDPPG